MKIVSIANAIVFAAMMLASNSSSAFEDALLNSKAQLIDGSGKVVGVINPSDSRNNKYEFYYSNIDDNGNVSSGSRYMVRAHPYSPTGGYVKYDLTKNEPMPKINLDADGSPQTKQQQSTQAQPNQNENYNGMVKNYDTTTSFNNKSLNKPRYSQDYKLQEVYR